MVRSLDPCPHCGTRAAQVTATGPDQGVVRPCGHHVRVVLLPDRVQLEAA
jgi:hypothetical protein